MKKGIKYEAISSFVVFFAISPTYSMLKGIYDFNINEVLVKVPACVFLWGLILFSLYKLRMDEDKKFEYYFGVFCLGFSFAVVATFALLQNVFSSINDRYIPLNLLIFVLGWCASIYSFKKGKRLYNT